jgi:hypothetical protein
MELNYKLVKNVSEAIEQLNRARKVVDIRVATGNYTYAVDGVECGERDLLGLANSLLPGNNFVRTNS